VSRRAARPTNPIDPPQEHDVNEPARWWSTRTNPWALAEGRDENRMWLAWLTRLRWVAIVGQLVTLSFTFSVLDTPTLVLPALLGLVVLLGAANGWAIQLLHHHGRIGTTTLVTHLAIDIVVLTAFFAAAGGWGNPFLVLYFIHVAIAAVILPARGAIGLMVLVVLANMALHELYLPLHPERHVLPAGVLMALGQVIAVTVTVTSVGTFILGMATSLRRQKLRLVEARDRTAQTDRLRAVGTLAAGAAHELNTPLSTIGLRLRRVARRHTDEATVADLEATRNQLARCTEIVEKLLVGAGDPTASGIERKPLQDFVQGAIKLWSKGSALEVQLSMAPDPIVVELPDVAFTQGMTNLLENAREAQEELGREEPLRVEVVRQGREGVVLVHDHGPGLPEQADRIGEPFFTTKPSGTGLGVVVARALADGAGGTLTYAREGDVTITRWTFPEHRRTP